MVSIKNLYLICYDIQKDKPRTKTADLLKQYGTRINYSVFECFVSPADLKKIYGKIEELCNKKTDFVKFYPICKNCYSKSMEIGNNNHTIVNHSIFL